MHTAASTTCELVYTAAERVRQRGGGRREEREREREYIIYIDIYREREREMGGGGVRGCFYLQGETGREGVSRLPRRAIKVRVA